MGAGLYALGPLAPRESPVAGASAPFPPYAHPVPGFGPFGPPLPAEDGARLLGEVRDTLSRRYYRQVSPEILAQPTIPLLLHALGDPHTEYLTPEEYAGLRERTSGRYQGVGLTVSRSEGGLSVTSARQGPAYEAGIRPGDLIISIDGEATGTIDFARALHLMRGTAGTSVKLTVRRPGAPRSIDFRVVRSDVGLPQVKTRLLRSAAGAMGYIHILSFSEDVSSRVRQAVDNLERRGARGLILDLRGNPGGLLTEAIAVTSLFVERGVVCSLRGVHQAYRDFLVTGATAEPAAPLAVIVDGNTASAAEVVAAALRDHGRAEVLGVRTYGKSTVQSVVPLSNGGALRLTTASYLTPLGATIGGTGIAPAHRALDRSTTVEDEALLAARKLLRLEI